MKRLLVLIVVMTAFALMSHASAQNISENKELILMPPPDQEIKAENSGNKIFVAVEQPAEFPGGNDALMHWLSNNIQYPDLALQRGIQGKVLVRFVVEKDGSISNVTVLKHASPDLDAEAVKVTSRMPAWSPGKINGAPIRAYCTLPIVFKINPDWVDDGTINPAFLYNVDEALEFEKLGDEEVTKGNIKNALAYYKEAFEINPTDLSSIEKAEKLIDSDSAAVIELYEFASNVIGNQRKYHGNLEKFYIIELYCNPEINVLEKLITLEPNDLINKMALQAIYGYMEEWDKVKTLSEELYPIIKNKFYKNTEIRNGFLEDYALSLFKTNNESKLIKVLSPFQKTLTKEEDESSHCLLYMLYVAYNKTGDKSKARKIKDWFEKNDPTLFNEMEKEEEN